MFSVIKGCKRRYIRIKMSEFDRLTVDSMMVKDVYTLKKDASVQEVAKKMKDHSIGSIVIVENKKPVGIITERDLVKRVIVENKNTKETKAEEIMSKPVIAVYDATPLSEAIDLMHDKKIRRLVAVNKDDETTGILTADDIGYNIEEFATDLGLEYLIITNLIRRRENE